MQTSTGPESTVPSAAPGGAGARLRRAGGHAGQGRDDGLQPADRQEPGSDRGRAGRGAPTRQSRDLPRAPVACPAQPGPAARARPRRGRPPREDGSRARREALAAGRGAAAESVGRLLACPGPGRGRDAQAGGRVHLHRASPARARRRPARRAARTAEGSPRRAAGHVPGSRGHLPGAREVRPRPDRARRAGQARPGHRARRGDPPRDPGPVATHEEQPGADRRPWRGEDRNRRGARAADRRRRRAGRPEGQTRVGARHRRAPCRLEVPR